MFDQLKRPRAKALETKSQTGAPPADGDAYLIGGAPSGAWSGYSYKIAACLDGAWRFYTPFDGLRAYVAPSKTYLIYRNGQWADCAAVLTGPLDLSASSAGQIKFPAAQNPSNDPNTLDDYEEGSFAPYFTSDGTAPVLNYRAAYGAYLKIGKLVFCTIGVTVDSVVSQGSGSLLIGGLPFATLDTNGALFIPGTNGWVTNCPTVGRTTSAGGTTLTMRYRTAPNGPAVNLTTAELQALCYVSGALAIYQAQS